MKQFNNKACYCVGTGRMNLALRHEYHEQLKKVQKEIGFFYIRGHGLFTDDMAVYHTYKDGVFGFKNEKDDPSVPLKEEYNFRYIDAVFDDYLSLGIKPFVELGFMPNKMASGDQTVFYWKGNVTPPSDYDKWAHLVTAAIEHWIKRYGIEEVLTWPFEVWNEPNLSVFWKDADMQEYFKLYDVTARAVKKIDTRLRVGGPAICGIDDERWMKSFLEYCRDNKVPLDFITRHAYGTEAPEHDGHYVYQKLRTPESFMEEPLGSRKIIDSFPEFKGMELHITEFNTSYSPSNPVHDTNLNAAYIAKVLSMLGESCASYSYWTFGDVFEEWGVSFTPFSGCFGLLANGGSHAPSGIPKPTYWTYVFYKQLYDTMISCSDNYIATKSSNKKNIGVRGIAWNLVLEKTGSDNSKNLDLTFDLDKNESILTYCLLIKTVDEDHGNPLKTWIDIGSPASPSKEQMDLLVESARPFISTKQLKAENGKIKINLLLKTNAVVYFELIPVKPETDRGFDIDKV